jgi:hypothetical protein
VRTHKTPAAVRSINTGGMTVSGMGAAAARASSQRSPDKQLFGSEGENWKRPIRKSC